MDEMKLKLSTNFMKSIVSKLIEKSIYKKYGCKVNVQLDELDINIIDGETTINANVAAIEQGMEENAKVASDAAEIAA